MQLQFFRMIFPGQLTVSFEDVYLNRQVSTLSFVVSQNAKKCVAGHIKYVTQEVVSTSEQAICILATSQAAFLRVRGKRGPRTNDCLV